MVGLGGMGNTKRGGFGSGGALGGGNDPVTFLGSDLYEMFDATKNVSVSGGVVPTWVGRKNVATLTATGTQQPTVSTISNGQAAIVFDGVNNYMSCTLAGQFPTGAGAELELWCLISQDDPTSDATTRAFFGYGSDSNHGISISRAVASSRNTCRGALGTGASNTSIDSTVVDFSGVHVCRVQALGGNMFSSIDGSLSSVASATANLVGTTLRIGASFSNTASKMPCKVVAALITKPLTDAKADKLRSYLMNRGGVSQNPYAMMGVGVSQTAIAISWPPFGATTTSYLVYRRSTLIATVATADLSYTDYNGPTANARFNYTVIAVQADTSRVLGGVLNVYTLASPLLYQTTFEENYATSTSVIGGWVKAAAATSSISIATDRSRSGSKSVKFDFNYSDWVDTDDGHRLMIKQDDGHTRINAVLGQDYWTGFSHYADSTWDQPDNSNNNDFPWQWHGQSGGPAGGTNPPLTAQVSAGTFSIILYADPTTVYAPSASPPPVTLFSTPFSNYQNKWTDWVIRANFNYTGGLIQVWVKDSTSGTWTKIVDYTGSTIYRKSDQTTEVGPWFDYGVYRDNWGLQPTLVSRRTMWFDEFRQGDATATINDVAPQPLQLAA